MDTGISEAERGRTAKALTKFLSNTYALYVKTHSYHWNVSGRQFQTLHDMFEAQYTELWQAVDEIAERIRALGFMAPAGVSALYKDAQIPEDNDVPAAASMASNLCAGHEMLVRLARDALAVAQEAGDDVSADLITGRMAVSEKTAWMLRALDG